MLDGDETQRGQIDLGVDLRGVWTAMTEMVPDFLEGHPRLDQMPGARVPQPMGTATFPWRVRGGEARGHNVIERPGRERPNRRAHGQEEGSVPARWPRSVDIAAEGVLDAGFERQDLSRPTLRTSDANAVRSPINIPHLEPSHLARPQPIDGEQSQNRPISPL